VVLVFILFGFKIYFKMALETNLNEKRKEKEKGNLTCCRGLEAHPRRPTPSLSSLMGHRSRARFSLSLSRLRGPAQELQRPRALSPLRR
jgi:hypothetical protein